MEADDPVGVRLGHYLDLHPGTNVLLDCLSCSASRVLPMAGVVKRLEARGRDPRKVGIREIAGMVEEPCGRCGKANYESRPAWPIREGMGRRVE